MSDGRIRAFFAVPPDEGWAESARAFLAGVRPGLPEASWTRPESWHLTLRFLGDVSREVLSAFSSAVGRAVSLLGATELRTHGAVVFPPRGAARVLGAGFEPDAGAAALAQIARSAEHCAREAGLEPESRPFHPHVTFARLRRPWPAAALAQFRAGAAAWTFPLWRARSCVLYESLLAPGGAVHSPVANWTLPAAAGTER